MVRFVVNSKPGRSPCQTSQRPLRPSGLPLSETPPGRSPCTDNSQQTVRGSPFTFKVQSLRVPGRGSSPARDLTSAANRGAESGEPSEQSIAFWTARAPTTSTAHNTLYKLHYKLIRYSTSARPRDGHLGGREGYRPIYVHKTTPSPYDLGA